MYYIPGVGIDVKLYRTVHVNKEQTKKSMGLPVNSILLISMGDLIKRKNYKVAIKAIAATKNRDIHYLICGEGPNLNQLKKLAIELGVEQQIHFLGYRNDIKELLAISDIFLLTSYQEGLPRSMMEAMASGLHALLLKLGGT